MSFTIRNKASSSPIITFGKDLLSKLLSVRPESATLAIVKHCSDYKSVTGKSLHVDYDQEQLLLTARNANADGTWKSKYTDIKGDLYFVVKSFEDGLLSQSQIHCDINDVIRRAEIFYDMLDVYMASK